jgi:hypothetical protein
MTSPRRIHLAERANILRLGSPAALDVFTAEYGGAPPIYRALDQRFGERTMMIDWRRVASVYDGIIIAPYQWSRRLDGGARWYYGWDCASGCIWNATAIARVEHLEAADA